MRNARLLLLFAILTIALGAGCAGVGSGGAPAASPVVTSLPGATPVRASQAGGTAPPSPVGIVTASPTLTPTLALTATPTATPTPAPSATPSPTTTARPTATPTATPTTDPGPLSGERLVAALRRGGYILYFRHAATQPTPDDAVPVVLSDCTTQRNLSDAGRAQSTAVGEAIARLGVPIGEVLASPFCRSLETAMLAFGRARTEPGVENLETVRDEAERQARIAVLQRLLSTQPGGATNTAIVAHGNILSATARVTVVEGGAAIFRPEGEGGFTLVATVTPAEWGELAAAD